MIDVTSNYIDENAEGASLQRADRITALDVKARFANIIQELFGRSTACNAAWLNIIHSVIPIATNMVVGLCP